MSGEAFRVVSALEQDVSVIFFFDNQQPIARQQFEEMMALFAEVQPRISYRSVDLDRSPAEAERYNIGGYNTGIIEVAGRTRLLRGIDQESLTDGILRLTQGRSPTLCFVTAHGEHSPESSDERRGYSKVAKALEKENYEIRTFDYVPAVRPEDGEDGCDVVILAGPQHDLMEGEADRLVARIKRGKAVLLLVDPWCPASFTSLLSRTGVRVFDDVIIDEQNRFFGADSFMPQVPVFDQQTFGGNLQSAAVFAIARTIHPGDDSEVGGSALLLALTADSSWARLGDTALPAGDVQFRNDRDKRGPLPAGVIVREKRTPEGAPKGDRVGPMIVLGDSDFAANNYLDILGNRDFFMSCIAVLAENQALVAERQKRAPERFSPLYVTEQQMETIQWVNVIVLPSLCAILGALVTWRRRRRAAR